MTAIKGYTIKETLHDGKHAIVYRAVRDGASGTVIIKVLKSEYPTAEQLSKFRHEFEIAREIQSEGVIKPLALEAHGNGLALILEDIEGVSLKEIINNHKINLKAFLTISRKLANILAQIHAHGVIHKDIKPQNIILNTTTGKIKFTDFGISTKLSRENPDIVAPNMLEGTLAYISPEQTGRMNRAIDNRSDFYSLGVTFYEMLTGAPPFAETADAMELVHSHIAIRPKPPAEVNSEVPETLSQIVMKLLEKNAEDRYQSGFWLRADLDRCAEQYNKEGKITPFTLAENDVSDKFQIPQALYGRESEVQQLFKAFQSASRGSVEIIEVTGHPGIGKSALINEVRRPLVEKRGYFISGKFDQFKRDIPYTALQLSLNDFVRQILTEDTAQIDAWKERILAALGPNGKVVCDIVTDLELLIGKQPAVAELPAAEAENRFNSVFLQFARAICREESPIVIFLDDMQWADSSSLKLLELILTHPELNSMLFLMAYRNNEIGAVHPLRNMIAALKQASLAFHTLSLEPLSAGAVDRMVSDTLHLKEAQTKALAEIVFRKTIGNPFFAGEFLKTLYQEKLINFNASTGKWEWDLARIEQARITDNVVELMADKIQKLKPETQEALRVASCIGNQFTLKTLSIAQESDGKTAAKSLEEALAQGLITPIGKEYRYIDAGANTEEKEIRFQFLHDRVQQAAYNLLDDQQRARVHYSIGRHLLDSLEANDVEEKLIEIVGHLNAGLTHITTPESRLQAAELNMRAAMKAKASTAYEPARKYIQQALELLPEGAWQKQYGLALQINNAAVAILYLNGENDRALTIGDTIIKHARTALDKVPVYSLRIQYFNAAQQADRALDEAALPLLRELGVRLPAHPGQLAIVANLMKTKIKQGRRKPEDLALIPPIEDQVKLAAIKILTQAAASAFFARSNLFPVIIFRVMQLSMRYGASSNFAYFMTFMGMVNIGVLGDIKSGHKFGLGGLGIIEKMPAPDLLAKMKFLLGYFVFPWAEPWEKTQPLLLESAQLSLEMGDPETRGFSWGAYYIIEYLRGKDLSWLNEEIEKYTIEMRRFKQEQSIAFMRPLHQFAKNMLGESENPGVLAGAAFNFENEISTLIEQRNFVAVFYAHAYEAINRFHFDDYAGARAICEANEKFLDAAMAAALLPYFFSVYILTLSRLAQTESDPASKKAHLKKAAALSKQLKKWSQHTSDNRLHLYLIAEAERNRALGNETAALKLYDRAIQECRDRGYIHQEALANELAADFYIQLGNEKVARTYMTDARYGYVRWRAHAKLKQLEKKYPEMFRKIQAASSLVGDTTSGTTSGSTNTVGTTTSLDIGTVVKASQALSGEIFLDQLLRRMMKIAIESAGAERGALLVESNGKLVIEAEGSVTEDEPKILQSIPLESAKNLPAPIIEYVHRTGENVVLGNAAREGRFVRATHIAENGIKSVLCVPITKQGKLVGILYLENNLSTNAFTPDRIEILNILTTQAAISLENARLVAEETERQKLQKEMEMAKQVQMSILPRFTGDDDYNITAHMTPADQVGGDYYDFYNINDKRWIAIGDVTGHGLNSGLMMLMAQTGFSTYLNSTSTPDIVEGFTAINKTLHMNMMDRTKQELYMTFTALCADNAGNFEHVGKHEDILVYRKSSGKVETIKSDGFWMGLVPDVKPMLARAKFTLNSGDFITLFTDGVIEGRNSAGEQFDTPRLISTIETFAAEGIERVKTEIVKACFDWMHKQDDDLTLFIMQKK